MAKDKNTFKRYKVLDQFFQTKSDLNTVEKLRSRLEDYDIYVSRRTIYSDINFMQSLDGYNAPIVKEKQYGAKEMNYFYSDPNFSINNSPLNSKDKQAIKEAIELLSHLGSVKGFSNVSSITTNLKSSLDINDHKKSIISFSENENLKGIEFLNDLFNLISNQQVLTIKYQSFHAESESDFTISPYYLKQYNNRWFLFGWNHSVDKIQNLALDRISSITKDLKTKYISTDIDFNTYFNTIIGVTLPDTAIEKIRLKFTTKRLPYIITKPIHITQKVDKDIVQITMRINRELISLIQSFGSDVTVLEPRSLVNQMKEEAEKMVLNYKND